MRFSATLGIKRAQSWLKLVKIGKIHDFYVFLRFLTNFIIFYYGQHFYTRYKTYLTLQGIPLAINTELQGSKGSPGGPR